MYRNSEGYSDPTAGAALASVIREERRRKAAAQRLRRRFMPKVYICSPFAGDVENNIRNARRYCAFAVRCGYIPCASHLFFPQFLRDSDPAQRELGRFMGLVYLDSCRECWVFGDTISEGMESEIKRAKKRGIIIRYFTDDLKEVQRE